MSNATTVTSNHDALKIARDYAFRKGLNEARAEAFAEVWFDAGMDDDKFTPEALRLHLDLKFNRV